MYGLIAKMIAAPGKRDDLIDILLEGVSGMPGNLSYHVAKDLADENALWITEVWESRDHHAASLSMPSVAKAIEQGRPLIAGMENRVETLPVGGNGLP